MRRTAIAGLVFTGLVFQEANAGSAVAIGSSGHLVSSYGLPKRVAEQHVLAMCRSLWGGRARLLASTDVVGEGAIAVARKGKGSVIGVSLGRRSATEAQARAIEQCRKSGGIDPVVKWGFRG